jgi:radical SAM protein with 4Fe4S-binding SPASM domain
MGVELTNRCQLRCPVCPTGAGILRRKPRMMDMGLLSGLMEEVGPYLLAACFIGWGEPLLHPGFAQAIGLCRRHHVLSVVSTNGQNLDEPRVREDLIAQPPTYLIVAVDGLTDRTHALYRVGGRLSPALAGVRALAEAKRRAGASLPLLHMRFIAMRHNQHELPGVRDFAAANGFDLVSIRSLSIIDDDERAHRARVPDVERFRAYGYDGRGRVARKDFLCQHAFCYPTVLADGTVVACDQDFDGRWAYGRIGEGVSFADVWFGRQSRAVRKTIRDRRQAFSTCSRCPYADRMLNTCSVSAYQFPGYARGAPACNVAE